MLFKPFRPPLIQKITENSVILSTTDSADQPPLKKRRLTPPSDTENKYHSLGSSDPSSPQFDAASASNSRLGLGAPSKSLLHQIKRPSESVVIGERSTGNEAYYNVVWRKFTTKKNKTWDGDGVLAVHNGVATLINEDGKELGRKRVDGPLLPEDMLSIGGRDVQVEALMKKEDYTSGRSFLGVTHPKSATLTDLDQKLRSNLTFKPLSKVAKEQVKEEGKSSKPLRQPLPSTKAAQSVFKNPVKDQTVIPQTEAGKPTPRHDPDATGAVVMKRPETIPRGKQIVDVVIDPVVSKNLRPHQKGGVKFMYECVMGMRPFSGDGAILADEMGLGKTLQVIALLWTLMKQNPIYDEQPVVKKALIVCPVTVVKNWKKEFRKWLGNERIGVFVFDDNKARLTDFTKGKSYSVMIIGYERLRGVIGDLQKGSGIDIVIADEGHRLKTASNKSAQAIKALATTRRIILSGTPLQNDLSEFYFTVDFVNPGLLGKYNNFKRCFEVPILKSRQPHATDQEKELGEARNEELGKLTSLFIIRRSADILSMFLPPKTEYVLFCRPTPAQAKVYRTVLSSPEFMALSQASDAVLPLITTLKKVCNSPSLLQSRDGESESEKSTSIIKAIAATSPTSLLKSPGASGKLRVLDSLLHRIRTTTTEKVVIVSHYTTTLDLLSNLCESLSYSHLRLDGSVPQPKRQPLVDRFNRTSASECFAFLLSAKSGGIGLNLIGASRLILFDNDWNPSADLQAMARIHRDGQKRPCRIYRLITKGALDEKIFQRQATKLSLADSVVDGKISTSNFSTEELRDLFRLDEGEVCQTHELLGCACGGSGEFVARGPDPVAKVERMIELREPLLKSTSAEKLADPGASDLSDDENAEDEPDRDGDESDDTDDGSEDLPPLHSLVKGTQVEALRKRAALEEKREAAAKAEKEQEKHKMMALMQYRHFDVTKLRKDRNERARKEKAENSSNDGEEGGWDSTDEATAEGQDSVIDDELLRDVLEEGDGLVSYIFAKSSK